MGTQTSNQPPTSIVKKASWLFRLHWGAWINSESHPQRGPLSDQLLKQAEAMEIWVASQQWKCGLEI